MEITADIVYVGVNDHDIDLFEGQYVVPRGMAYNSYLVKDAKTAVMDTVDARFGDDWMGNVAAANGGKKVLLVANMGDQPVDAEFELNGANSDDAEVIMTNCEYKNTLTGKEIVDGKLTIPAYTCLEIRF